MRLERLFKVLVVGGMALGSGAAACSDDGAAGHEGQSATGGASGAGGSASGGTAGSGGAVVASGGGSAGSSAGSGGSSSEDSGPDVLVLEDGGTDDASDAQTDGVDSWLSWFS